MCVHACVRARMHARTHVCVNQVIHIAILGKLMCVLLRGCHEPAILLLRTPCLSPLGIISLAATMLLLSGVGGIARGTVLNLFMYNVVMILECAVGAITYAIKALCFKFSV